MSERRASQAAPGESEANGPAQLAKVGVAGSESRWPLLDDLRVHGSLKSGVSSPEGTPCHELLSVAPQRSSRPPTLAPGHGVAAGAVRSHDHFSRATRPPGCSSSTCLRFAVHHDPR